MKLLKGVFRGTFLFIALVIGLQDQAYSQFNPSTNLVAHYQFNGDSLDSSGNGYDLIIDGAQFVADNFGNSGGALSFDGVDDFAEITHGQILEEITWATYVKFKDFGSGKQKIIIAANGAASMGIQDSTIESIMELGRGNFVYLKDSVYFSTDRWYHLVSTYDKSVFKFYIDGNLISEYTSSGDIDYDDQGMWLGGPINADTQPTDFSKNGVR